MITTMQLTHIAKAYSNNNKEEIKQQIEQNFRQLRKLSEAELSTK